MNTSASRSTTQPQNQQQQQEDLIRQIEKGLSPIVVKEVQKEYQEKKNNNTNVTYLKEKPSLKTNSVVNPSNLQYQSNTAEDDEFLARLHQIKDEYGIVKSLLMGSRQLKEKYKLPLIAAVEKYTNNVKMLDDSYKKKLPIIKLNKEYQSELNNYRTSLIEIGKKLNLLEKAGWCSKNRINREVKWAGELLQKHDNLIQAWLHLEPRNIILNSGEVIIEKIVEAEPNEEKIRASVARHIKDFLPKQKAPEPIIQTKTEKIYVPAEPDLLGKAHQLLYGHKNYAEAIKILRELDGQGNMDAQATLGTVYMEGMGVRKDVNKAAEFFKKAIKGGNAESMYKLATLLEKGTYKEAEDRQTNIVKAIELYNKAAQKDELNALTDLAYLLENGKYVQKNVNEAYKLLKRAADLYYPRALNNLGSMYFKGLISDKGRPNDQKAFEYFKLAADQGYPKAYTNLGICYEKGIAVPKHLERAIEFYLTAAELHDVDGIFHLGFYTMDQATRNNEEEKYAEAADMFREAISIDPEYAEAYYYLGFMFENGFGVDRDMKSAFRYYKKAGERGHAKSWTKVGTFLNKGFGVEVDPDAALLAYDRAVELGDEEAMNILGVIYEEGLEVPPDFERAFEYYAMAAEQGCGKAKLNIGLMIERGRIESNLDVAVSHYYEAAEMGNTTAKMMLSTRDLNTPYKGRRPSRLMEQSPVYDEVDGDTIETENKSGSPGKKLSPHAGRPGNLGQMQISTNATSQYVKGKDLNKNLNLGNVRMEQNREYEGYDRSGRGQHGQGRYGNNNEEFEEEGVEYYD